MSRLEVEYDYDTENEQLVYSKDMLKRDLLQAIEFYIREDPFKLVENINLWWGKLMNLILTSNGQSYYLNVLKRSVCHSSFLS